MSQTRRNPLAGNLTTVTLASEELPAPHGRPSPEQAATAPPLLYDYSLIDEQHRSQVMLLARRIKLRGQRMRNDLLEAGRELSEAKERLPHGQFGDWLAVEFEMSDRSARRFMRIYEGWKDQPEAISLLSDRTLYLLADPDAPAEAKVAVVEQARTTGRSPTTKQVQAVITAHRPPPPPAPPATFVALAIPDRDEDPPRAQGLADDAGQTDQTEQEAAWQDAASDDEPALLDLVATEAHIWRVALLAVGHDLAKLQRWVTEHDQPDHYHTNQVPHLNGLTFQQAYESVIAELATKYGHHQASLPLPPTEQPADGPPSDQHAVHNGRINRLIAQLAAVQQIDFAQYSNSTGDYTSPNRLRNILDVMLHNLERNRR